MGAVFLGISTFLNFADSAHAITFNFSFSNENGPISGTVEGTIELPDGDGTFAATSVFVTSAPVALLGYDPTGFDFTSFSVFENSFTVTGGNIDSANSSFFGLFDGSTALGLNSLFAGGATFLDVLNGGDFGATGLQDADSSTLSYSSPSATPVPEPMTILGSVVALGIGTAFKRKAIK